MRSRASRRAPSDAIRLGEGFVLPTRWRTISRWQRALPGPSELPLLLKDARRQAARRPPNPYRILVAIVPHVDAPVVDAGGTTGRAVSDMTPRQVDHCRACFAEFTSLVFACTGGALQIEATEIVLPHPVRRLTSMGQGRYWLSAADAFAGREDLIPRDELDSIAVYYKMPPGVIPGLHGGAVGRDHGLRGSAYFTLWVSHWDELVGPLNRTVIASLHEWLHNVSFYAHRVMGETAIADCHAGEEYGYWDTDGGYPQWQAWNRDLMLRYTPRDFWYRLTSRGSLLPSERLKPVFAVARLWRRLVHGGVHPSFGRRFHRWRDVESDWMRRLPQLTDGDLRSITRLPDLEVRLRQAAPNTHVVWALHTDSEVESPYAAGDPPIPAPRLDNVLSLGRLPGPGPIGDAAAAYFESPLESMAWLRSPRAERDRRDLVLLRVDVAPWLVPRLRVVGRPAAESVIGYLARRDPSEGQRLNLIVLAVDFGNHPPRDEIEAYRA